jgi:cytosine/adenosine deaminase-related metal-dependent hydrolase
MASPMPGGFVLQADGVWSAGTLAHAPLVLRDGKIAAQPSPGDRRIDLRGQLIFPALINAHEHLHVNVVPPLRTDAPFANSYAWMDACQAHFRDPAVIAARALPKALRLRHGALKNLLAGTTGVVHHDPWHPELDEADFPVTLLRDFGWSYALAGPDFGPPVVASFRATPPDRPWMIHLAEGTDAVAAGELAALDTLGCLAPNTVLVHGTGLREDDVTRTIDAGAAVVWCPGSNRRLLGRTLDPRRLAEAGRLMLGSDARVSGERDLLEALRGVLDRDGLDAQTLLDLVTHDAASLLRWPSRGQLTPGMQADLLIVADRGGEPARSLVGVSRAELRAVVRDGVPRIADPDFADWFAAAGIDVIAVTLDGRPKLLDRRLADPALFALEPGLDLAATVAAPAVVEAC